MESKKSYRMYSLIFAGLILSGVFYSQYIPPGMNESKNVLSTASVKSFDVIVNTVGVLDAVRSHMVTSMIRGDKGKIMSLVEDGTRVQKGDVLVRLDPTPFEEDMLRLTGEMHSYESAVRALEQAMEWERSHVDREIETAEFNVKIAELELKKIERGEGRLQMAQLKSDMETAGQKYQRYTEYAGDLEDLEKKGYSNPTEITHAKGKMAQFKEAFDVAQEKYTSYRDYVLPSLIETAKAKLERARMEHEQTKKAGVFTVAKAMAEVEQAKRELETAKATLQQARTDLENTTIYAPISGIAILYEMFRGNEKRKPRVGDTVWQNQPLLYLPDISSMIVKTQVREIDLHKIAKGQTCTIQVDAFPDVHFAGEVTQIGILATERLEGERGDKYFQLTASVKGEDPRLRPGMTSRLSIMTNRVTDALSVPIQSIFSEGEKKFCYVYERGGFRKAEVTLGRQNEELVEILSGLKGGEKISLVRPDPDGK